MLDLYVAHMGFFLRDIKVIGKSAYFGVPELGVDALKAAHPVLAALWRYSDELSAGPVHPLVGAGFVLPTGIEGGGYIAVPGECAISLIAKIPPGVDLDRVREGLEKAARAAIADDRIRLEFSYPASRDHRLGGTAFEDAPDEARLERLRSSVRAVRPDRGAIEAAPYWSELPIFSAWEFLAFILLRAISVSATRPKRTSRSRTITTACSRSPSSSPGPIPRPLTAAQAWGHSVRLTDLAFEQWIEHAFGHEVRHQRNPWFFDPDPDWWDPKPVQPVDYLTRLFEEPDQHLEWFTDAQIARGLTYLVSTSVSGEQWVALLKGGTHSEQVALH